MAARPSRGPADVAGTTDALPSSVNEPIPLISETDSSHLQRDIESNIGTDEIQILPDVPGLRIASIRRPGTQRSSYDPIQFHSTRSCIHHDQTLSSGGCGCGDSLGTGDV